VAVVVISWNGREDTLSCLQSLLSVEYTPLSVIVVNNGSSDGTEEAVREGFRNVVLVRCEENLGFAAGNNVGIRRALELGADSVLILNNDVEVEPGFITPLVDVLGRRPDAGGLCPKILCYEARGRIWFVGARFNPRTGHGRHLKYRKPDDPQDTDVRETERVCGAALLVSKTVLREVGLFDPDLFLYCEDIEWSLRGKAQGRKHYVVPTSRIYHKVAAKSGGERMPTPIYYGTRNTLVVCERWAALGRVGTSARRAFVVAIHVARGLTSPRRADSLRAVREGWRDFQRGQLGRRLP